MHKKNWVFPTTFWWENRGDFLKIFDEFRIFFPTISWQIWFFFLLFFEKIKIFFHCILTKFVVFHNHLTKFVYILQSFDENCIFMWSFVEICIYFANPWRISHFLHNPLLKSSTRDFVCLGLCHCVTMCLPLGIRQTSCAAISKVKPVRPACMRNTQ